MSVFPSQILRARAGWTHWSLARFLLQASCFVQLVTEESRDGAAWLTTQGQRHLVDEAGEITILKVRAMWGDGGDSTERDWRAPMQPKRGRPSVQAVWGFGAPQAWALLAGRTRRFPTSLDFCIMQRLSRARFRRGLVVVLVAACTGLRHRGLSTRLGHGVSVHGGQG